VQISESFSDRAIEFAGVKLPLGELAGGVLVLGQTGSGKTQTIINPLARQISELGENAEEKFAVVYFGIKGGGHLEFAESLGARAQDVVRISAEGPAVRLFLRDNWSSQEDMNLAVVEFVEEVSDHVSQAAGTFRHDVFWDRQRKRILSTLCALTPTPFAIATQSASALHHPDALVALLSRLDAFLDFVGKKSSNHTPAFDSSDVVCQTLRRHGLKTPKDLTSAKTLIQTALQMDSPKRKFGRRARDLAEALGEFVETARSAERKREEPMLLEVFAASLTAESNLAIRDLAESWWRVHDQTRGIVEADLRGVVECFRRGVAGKLFAPAPAEVTLEEIVHEGKILILDLPIAESGGSTLTALLAAKIALTRLLVGRYRALNRGHALSRRGVLVIQDEMHLLLSRPKNGASSEAAALSVIREFGVVWVLACQSMSLIASTLGSETQTAALLAGARTRVFGTTSDAFTAQMASVLCGSAKGQSRPLGCLWHPTPPLKEAIAGTGSNSVPLVLPEEFYSLKTGEYILRGASGDCWRLDLRRSRSAPDARRLGRSAED
jgi:hypothetical protein